MGGNKIARALKWSIKWNQLVNFLKRDIINKKEFFFNHMVTFKMFTLSPYQIYLFFILMLILLIPSKPA